MKHIKEHCSSFTSCTRISHPSHEENWCPCRTSL